MNFVISGLIVAIMAFLSVYLFNRTNLRLFNFSLRSSSPVLRAFVGPIIMVLAGFLCLLFGYICVSPILLFYYGHTYWAIGLLALEAVISHYTSFVQINDMPFKPDFPWDIPFGLLCFWIMGFLCIIVGMILASPVLLLI